MDDQINDIAAVNDNVEPLDNLVTEAAEEEDNEVVESFAALQLVDQESNNNVAVYNAARDGLAETLHHLLDNKPIDVVTDCLDHLYTDSGQVCSPLIIAARNGHEKTVQTLLTRFTPNLETEGTVKFDGHVIEGATALWCAAGAGHLMIVTLLVEAGADVNHVTRQSCSNCNFANQINFF